MPKPPIKYNPAFLSDEELAAAFVVRDGDRALVVRVIRENTAESNQHVLIVGPRGIGKTMLVRRVALEVRQDEELCEKWYPLIFAEESYEVGTAGEFWLEAIFHLANQTGDAQWTRTYEDLNKREPVEDRLRDRALAQLMDFADSQGKRILLIVENLNMILGEQIHDDCAWKLRHTLMHEPRIMLLATATTRLDRPENTQKAMFELFKTQVLQPLNDAECQAVWRLVAGHDLGPRRIRALSILTGGNPRLLAIISHFGARLSFAELMQDLTGLVDDHTDYFKSHLDALPPTERRAYVALADLWDPATAREVAAAARQNVSMTSALLQRLVSRGAVAEVPAKGRTKRYEVAERMYNIYYLMRRRGSPSERVKAAVRFMVQFYEESELVEVAKRISEEASRLSCEDRQYHYHAFEGLVRSTPTELRSKVLECVPRPFLEAQDRPVSLRQLLEEVGVCTPFPCESRTHRDEQVRALIEKGDTAARDGRAVDAEMEFRKALDICPDCGDAWVRLAQLIGMHADRENEVTLAYVEAEAAYRKAIEINPKSAWAWAQLGQLLHERLERYPEAETAYRRAIEINPKSAWAWAHLWQLLHERLERYAEAETAYSSAIEIDPRYAWAWGQLGQLLSERLERYAEAEAAYHKAIDIEPRVVRGRVALVRFVLTRLNESTRALELAQQALTALPDNGELLNGLAWVFYKSGPLRCLSQAEAWARKSSDLEGRWSAIHTLACVLARAGKGAETLSLTRKLLDQSGYAGTIIDDMVTLFAELVAAGLAADAIPVLRDSKCAVTLEPILVALRMYLGEDVPVAPEIGQMAKDVLKRFSLVRETRLQDAKH